MNWSTSCRSSPSFNEISCPSVCPGSLGLNWQCTMKPAVMQAAITTIFWSCRRACWPFWWPMRKATALRRPVMMAMTCALFRSCSTGLDEPDKMLAFINENLCKVNRESFVTAIYAVYDAARKTLRIACAGHPLPILYRLSEKKAVEIPCDSVLLMGLRPYADVPVTEVALHTGDRLLFYTDGGHRPLQQIAGSLRDEPPAAAICKRRPR